MLGIRYMIEGPLPKEIYEFNQPMHLNFVYFLLAVWEFQIKPFEEAKSEWLIALRINHPYHPARIQLVLFYIVRENNQQIPEDFNKFISSGISLPQKSYAYKIFYKMLKILQWIWLQSCCPRDVYHSLGIVYFLIALNGEAQKYWRLSLAIYPDRTGIVDVLNRFIPENENFSLKKDEIHCSIKGVLK